jgi:hypothetical protein
VDITRIACETEGEGCRVVIETNRYAPIYFLYSTKIPEHNLGELALAVLLIPAMLRGETLSIPTENPICPVLLKNFHSFQEVFCQWYPELSKVDIVAAVKPASAPNLIKGVSSFSGGVDSLYTVFQVRQQIDQIMLCCGLDMQLSETQRIEESKAQCRFFAEQNKVGLVTVETNLKESLDDYNGKKMHGVVLIGLMLALCPAQVFIPASDTVSNLEPWGSHPLTDPLLSTGSTHVIHHAAIRRSSKLRALASSQHTLDMLRVCNASDQYNCSECEKCLRTMFVLEVLGKTSAALKRITAQQLKKLRLYDEGVLGFWKDNRDLAGELGNEKLYGLAAKIVNDFEFRHHFKRLLTVLNLRSNSGDTQVPRGLARCVAVALHGSSGQG